MTLKQRSSFAITGIINAIKESKIELLECISGLPEFNWHPAALTVAVQTGNVAVANSVYTKVKNPENSDLLMELALGNIPMMDWVYAHGFPTTIDPMKKPESRIEIIKWFRDRNLSIEDKFISGVSKEFVTWYVREGLPLDEHAIRNYFRSSYRKFEPEIPEIFVKEAGCIVPPS